MLPARISQRIRDDVSAKIQQSNERRCADYGKDTEYAHESLQLRARFQLSTLAIINSVFVALGYYSPGTLSPFA